MSHQQAPSFTYRLRPQPKWNPPTFVSEDQWRKTLETTWNKHLGTAEAKYLHDLSENIDVNKEWTSFMKLLSKVYKEATRATAVHIRSQANEQELEKKLSQVGHGNGKGGQSHLRHRDSIRSSKMQDIPIQTRRRKNSAGHLLVYTNSAHLLKKVYDKTTTQLENAPQTPRH